MNIETSLAFDDVLLVPQYSEINSRANVNLSVQMGDFKFDFPIIPANMVSVIGPELIREIYKIKGLSILHRFIPIEDQLEIFKSFNNEFGSDFVNYFSFSIGVKSEDYSNVVKLISAGAKILTIDIAHADSLNCIEMIQYIKTWHPSIFLIAGNIATPSAAERLWKAGADVVKCGIGGSMVCTTRVVSGNGYPQFSMLMNIAERKKKLEKELNKNLYIIADGACRIGADFVKSLCFADMVMAGGYFAGADECPGDMVEVDGKKYKRYDGSSTLKNRVEGVKSLVPIKGPAKNLFEKINHALASGCSYQGVDNLTDLKENPEFIRLSQASIVESYPHDVKVIG